MNLSDRLVAHGRFVMRGELVAVQVYGDGSAVICVADDQTHAIDFERHLAAEEGLEDVGLTEPVKDVVRAMLACGRAQADEVRRG